MTALRPVEEAFTVFLIAGEESGDILGAELMAALSARLGPKVRFVGVGGHRMAAAGVTSLFPMDELALHGYSAVLLRLPRLIGRLREAVDAVIAAKPDVLVLVDAPSFNLRVARRVRRRDPSVPIVDYVSPTVWAYFPWRARRMAPVVDEVMAILPFEPEAHRRLGGPPCVYVGHPLLTRRNVLRPSPGERPDVAATDRPTLLVLPGSRRSEISRLMAPFGAAVAEIAARFAKLEVVLPAVARLRQQIDSAVVDWPVKPTIVEGEPQKLAAFRRAHAALAASGTVTLELALAAVPMVVAYRVDPLVRLFKRAFKPRSIVLANIILDTNVIPEFVDGDCTPDRLSAAVVPLLRQSPERAAQLAAFAHLDGLMATPGGAPADLAAAEVIETVRRKRLPVTRGGG
jgi:lipid-A-disaccharide synthase